MGEAQAEVVEAKKMVCWAVKWGNRSIDEIYTPAFSRARGVTKVYLFLLD
jgi:hypothetical protein